MKLIETPSKRYKGSSPSGAKPPGTGQFGQLQLMYRGDMVKEI